MCVCVCGTWRDRCETVERGGTPCVTLCVSSVCRFRSMSPPQRAETTLRGVGWVVAVERVSE